MSEPHRPVATKTGPWPAAAVMIAAAGLVYWLLPHLTAGNAYPPYTTWATPHDGPLHWLMWVVGDTTEPQFYKSALAGVGMLAGGVLAWTLLRSHGRAAGFPISYGTGLFGWILAAGWLSLALANLLFDQTIGPRFAWQPTFVTFVSVPAATVLLYGPGWATCLTGAVAGALLTTPVSLLVVDHVCAPLHLPTVVGNVTGMWVGGFVAFTLYRVLPWMRMPTPEPPPDSPEPGQPNPAGQEPPTGAWLIRRALADFTEPAFYGNEWASIGLIAGVVVEYLLNPASPVYGGGALPAVLAAQLVAAGVGVSAFHRRWMADGFYPTFIPLVSITPAIVLTLGSSPWSVLLAGAVGALTGPPLGAWLATKLPKDHHPYVAYVMSMTICCATLVPLLGWIAGGRA